MNKDLFGKALLDYQSGNYSEDIITWTNISDEDKLPLPWETLALINRAKKTPIQPSSAKPKPTIMTTGALLLRRLEMPP